MGGKSSKSSKKTLQTTQVSGKEQLLKNYDINNDTKMLG